MDLNEIFNSAIAEGVIKLTLSKPNSDAEYRKITVSKTEKGYFAEQFTDKQVFHKIIEDLLEYLKGLSDKYLQINIWTSGYEHIVLISKKGNVSYKRKATEAAPKSKTHNRKKNYLIEEGTVVPPLVDMGIFTQEGKIVRSMYDKFRQINRFLELIDDEIKNKSYKEINIIDFGCGKSYLTFIVYYYLTEIMNIKANITGLDLKADVIESCNKSAHKYGYSGLTFKIGDINGYKCDKKPDMVITLHACDTATDYALFNAMEWGADMIFSVPCCQHELNSQMGSDKLSILTRYGIIKERTAALMTDAIRANILWYKGYNTQLLEFVDMSHTPKNILIRAVKSQIPQKTKDKYLEEAENLINEFGFNPTLYRLIQKCGCCI